MKVPLPDLVPDWCPVHGDQPGECCAAGPNELRRSLQGNTAPREDAMRSLDLDPLLSGADYDDEEAP